MVSTRSLGSDTASDPKAVGSWAISGTRAGLSAQTLQLNADLILRRKVAPDRAANAVDSLIRTFLGRHGFGLILMRTLPSVGKLKSAGKNMSRLGTQIDKRLVAELSVMEKQGV